MGEMDGTEVLIEFQRFGAVVKVNAVDPVTLTEVSIQGPANAGVEALKRAAVAKLTYVLARKNRLG